MRNIEFKAKSHNDGRWYYGLLSDINLYTCTIKKYNGFGKICDTNTICEYIGLEDMDGNRIYENDVVDVICPNESYLVEYDPDTARYVLSNDEGIIFDFDSVDCRVVRNRFD